jgi:hypothetical protein
MQSAEFPRKYSYYIFLPLALGASGAAINGLLAGASASRAGFYAIYSLLWISSIVFFIIGYVAEIKFMRRNYPSKSLKPQLILVAACFIAPIIAASLGDAAGVNHFGASDINGGSNAMVGVAAGGLLAALFVYLSAVSSLVYIRSAGTSSFHRIFARIFYIIGWLITAVVAYAVYGAVYSFHDPNTE